MSLRVVAESGPAVKNMAKCEKVEFKCYRQS
jgi:hypothetical protein